MSNASYYMRPDENWAYGSTVTLTAGAVDSDYTASWLVDGRSGRPVRTTTGTATFRLAKTAGVVDAIVVANHNLDAGLTITVAGDIATTLTVPTARANGIPYNPYKVSRNPSVDVLTLAVVGNSVDIVIGEVFAGALRAFPNNGSDGSLVLSSSPTRERQALGRPSTGWSAFVPPYDTGIDGEVIRGTVLCDADDLNDIWSWFDAQKNGSLPSVIILDDTIQDARIVTLLEPQATAITPQLWEVALTFQEYPRVRW